MTKKAAAPSIRFKGFSDAWEQRKFGDITELKSASRVHKGEWTDSGVPFFRSSDVMAAINGTTNEKAYISEELYQKLSSVSGKLEKGDVLITGGGSVGNPYIVPNNEPLYTKDADLLWIKNQGRFHPYYLYEYFFSPTFRTHLSSISHVGTIAHYTITQLSETPICLPDIEEQVKVGEYFESLDNLITLHQRKYEKLTNVKKSMLEKMFPQNGSSYPEIRFKGFTDPWEQRKVGDFYDFKNGLNKGKAFFGKGTPIVNFTDVFHKRGITTQMLRGRVTLTPSEISNYGVKQGDIFVTRTSETIEEIGYASVMLDSPKDTVFSGFVLRGRAIKEDPLTLKFKQFVFSTDAFRSEMIKKSSMTTRALTSGTAIKKMYFQYPVSTEEQNRIGQFLESLDHLITLHQRELEKLQNIKKSMLEKMFV